MCPAEVGLSKEEGGRGGGGAEAWSWWARAGRACGGTGESEGSGLPGLIEVIFRDRLGVGGIERGGLVEVVGEGCLGGLVVVPPVGPDESRGELSLGRSPGGVDEGG